MKPFKNSRIVLLSGVVILLLLMAFYFKEKASYKELMELRLDPLEENTLKVDNLNSDKQQELWIYGDSRAQDWKVSFLESIQMSVQNRGLRKQTTRQVLERLENDLKIDTPDYILIQVGINDLKCMGFLENRSITNNCVNNSISMLKKCKEKGITTIYTSIFPAGKVELLRKPLWKEEIRDSILYVNQKIKEYCSLNDIVFFDSYSLLLDNTSKYRINPKYAKDFLHLNLVGYSVLSENLIIQFLNKLNCNTGKYTTRSQNPE